MKVESIVCELDFRGKEFAMYTNFFIYKVQLVYL